ncbi:transposase [Streptomyces sp. NRRL F-5727]|uniref:transposase n=1 Tax=Streptomyces sp. NRRL F-5727 TaxID=1463871 RepID=UPI003B63B37F
MDHGGVIRRHELPDAEWKFVRPLLPVSLRGQKRLDDRRVLPGIVWKFRTGTAWRDVPEDYGPWATLLRVFAGVRRTGRSTGCCGPPRPGRTRRATSTGSSRSTPPSSELTSMPQGPEKGAPQPRPRPAQRRTDQQDAPGLRRQRPSPGLHRDGRQHQPLHLVHHRDGSDPGATDRPRRTRVRPDHVLGDKGYSSQAIRTWLRRWNIPHTIPERADQARNRARRGSRGGRPAAFDREVYKHRNVVERCFNRLKQGRGIATRYD